MTERRAVLVTGGGRGIGAAIVRALAGAGFAVDFTYRTAAEQAQALVQSLASDHPGVPVAALPVDLADRAAVDALADRSAAQGYYGFVHNAGMAYDRLVAMIDQSQAETVMQVNFWSLARIAKSVLRPMTAAGTGRIVVIGSVAGLRGGRGNAIYAASKAAALGLVRTLVLEAARKGVTANYVAPGFVDTEMLSGYASHRERLEAQIPVGRYAKPEEIAAVVAFLLSDGAAYVNGAVVPVDGGIDATLPVQR